MRRYFWLTTMYALFGWACPAQGGSGGDLDSVRLEEIVVTATKTEKGLGDVPGSVTVVDRQEMKKKDIKTLDDALNTLPGVFVKRSRGLMDSVPSVRMRGFARDNYTLILLDGQPLNDAYGGGINWNALPVENIERIEVIRGPASALYGGNAMGGVINIITKTPRRLELEAGGGYGTHDAYRYHISAGNRFWDRLGLRLGYEEEGTDGYATSIVYKTITSGSGNVSGGYPMNDKYGNPKYWVVGDKGDNGAERRSLNGKVELAFSDTGNLSLTAVSGRYEYDYGPPHTYMKTFGDTSTYAIAGPNKRARFQPNDFINSTGIGRKDSDTYTLTFKELFGPVELHAQAGTVQVDRRYTLEKGTGMNDYDDSPGSLSVTESETWFGEIRGDVPLGGSHLLTLGASYRTDEAGTNEYNIPFYRSYSGRGPSTFYAGGDSRTWAVFAQDEWQVIDPVTIYLGLRYDSWRVSDGRSGAPGQEIRYESNTESEPSPKVSVVYKALANTTLKASAGHAFRPPTIYELYRTWKFMSTTYQANPALKPETMWAYELGIEQYLFDKKTRLSLTGYRNDIDDLVYYQTKENKKIKVNAGKARTYGLEIDVSQKPCDWLTLWGNYTYTNAKIIDNPADPASEGKRVTDIPRHTWNVGLDLEYRWLKGSLVGRYFSKIYTDSANRDKEEGVWGTYEPAFVMDGKVTVTPLKGMDLSLSVDNILDERYYEYYRTDGRTFFLELTLRY